jgi:hypothetical protein
MGKSWYGFMRPFQTVEMLVSAGLRNAATLLTVPLMDIPNSRIRGVLSITPWAARMVNCVRILLHQYLW